MRTLTLRLGFLLPSAILCLVILPACDEPLPDADLLDNLWTLESIFAPGEPIILVGSGRAATIQFSDDNSFEGESFCNENFGTYDLSENGKLKITSFISTLRGCPSEDLWHNEDAYLPALPQVHSYRIESHVLRLYFDDDSMMKFNLAE